MDELLTLEDELWRANREGDGEFYARMLRDDALAVSKWGLLTKADAVPGISANRNPYLKTDLSGQRVIRLDDDNAIVTYRADVTARQEEQQQEVSFSVYASTVYHREPEGWRVVFHQQSML